MFDKADLIKYRLEKSEETFLEAVMLSLKCNQTKIF